MNKIIEWFDKKRMLVISLFGSIGFFLFLPKKMSFLICEAHNSFCFHLIGILLMLFLICVTIFIPILIMWSLKKEIFYFWRKTLFIYLFIYLFILIITPWSAGEVYFKIEKDLFALVFSIMYFIFSFILIIFQYFKNK